jgi:hypothetical protein
LKDLYYFILFLPSLLLYQIKNHYNVKDYVSLVFEGFNTHEIHNV